MSSDHLDNLLKSMPKIAEAVNLFKSEEVQKRAFEVLITGIGTVPVVPSGIMDPPFTPPTTVNQENEIPGIAIKNTDGSIQFTFRDIKAKSAADAGIRITLLAALVHEKLTGQEELSRKKILNPLLEDWRVYDGNLRDAINEHRGIINTRTTIKLDSHAKDEAKKIIQEVLDDSIVGKWNPSNVSKSTRKTKKKAKK